MAGHSDLETYGLLNGRRRAFEQQTLVVAVLALAGAVCGLGGGCRCLERWQRPDCAAPSHWSAYYAKVPLPIDPAKELGFVVLGGPDERGALRISILAGFYARGHRPPLVRRPATASLPCIESKTEKELDDFCLSVVATMELLSEPDGPAVRPISAELSHPSTRYATTGWHVSVYADFPSPLSELRNGERLYVRVKVGDTPHLYAIPTIEELASAASRDEEAVVSGTTPDARARAIFWQVITFPDGSIADESQKVPFP